MSEKKRDKSKFWCLDLLFVQHFKIKIHPNMSEQEKKSQKINDLLNAKTKPRFLCLAYTRQKKV